MRFAIVGVGGVGGYFGARLAQAGHDVTFIARGAHLEAITRAGLHVHSARGDVLIAPAKATATAEGVGPVDCVVLAVKAWQVAEAARSAAPLVGPHTLVLPLQNGVEAPEQVAQALGREHALGGVAKIISFVSSPGHIQHAGADPALTLGALDPGASPELRERVDALCRALDAAEGMVANVAPDIQVALWEKFLFITSWASVGAVTRAPMGIVRRLPETRRLLEGSLAELERIARAHGVKLEPSIASDLLAFMDTLPEGGTASLQRDIASGHASELDNLTGAAVRLGARVGVPTPINAFLYAALLPLEQKARGALTF
ncbi:MAG TPA: 2-dehydropantoate 2-reductase [Polyangiaceae bacterium]|nr:2-dehydropantoate 2-reductase [Polyangiaceae bacterium]